MCAVAAAALAVAWLMPLGSAAWAASPHEELCRESETEDTPRPIPESLVPAAVRLFQLAAMPPDQVERSTLYRCVEGQILLCNLGANLPCDKADTSRDLPAAEAWCAENPSADFIPMYVTGHDTIYRWRCQGAKAETTGEPLEIDRQGFISRYWKPADAAANPRR